MKFFIDLDDTLVYSTELNNDAYNFALEMVGEPRINTTKRITRSVIKANDLLDKIIWLKQKYFMSEWLRVRVRINKILLRKIEKFGVKNCYLWTKADRLRVERMLTICDLKKYFNGVIYASKNNFAESIKLLKKIDKKFIIYENNHNFFNGNACKIVDCIKDNVFDVKGFLIE